MINNYIEDLYINYQSHFVNDSEELEHDKEFGRGRKILIIAPGKSIEIQKEEINQFINENNPFIFSVNFIPASFAIDAVFISNQKRFDRISDVISEESKKVALITTSNITNSKEYSALIVNYSDLLIDNPIISDNAGLMLLNLLNRLSLERVYFAGFDGFSINKTSNYFSSEMNNNVEIEELVKKNEAISNYLSLMEKNMNIHFITSTVYRDDFSESIIK